MCICLAILPIDLHVYMYYNIITVKGTEARLENELAGSSEAINKRRGCCLRYGKEMKPMEQEESEQMITAIMRDYLKMSAKKQAQVRDKIKQITSGEEESQNERKANHQPGKETPGIGKPKGQP